MGYLVDPTRLIYDAISGSPEALKRLQTWWDEPLRDAYGIEVPQNKYERIQGLQDWFYCEAEAIHFRNPFMATLFDSLTDADDIDWEQLHYLLHSGVDDED